MSRPLPRALASGDRVAVVACSSPFPVDDFHRGIAWWRERGRVVDDPRWLDRQGYLAGSDAHRTAALLDAVADPAVRCVHAARGGYGALRLLERAGDALAAALARDPKALVGFSDVTVLHALWARCGVRAVHGPMVAAIGRGSPHADELWDVLRGQVPGPWEGLATWHPGTSTGMSGGAAVTGQALGGNLALLAALSGTPWQFDLEGAVLLLEDVSERPYRLDRMLTTLRLAGTLRGIAAVVLGEFTDCAPGPDGATAEVALRQGLGDLGVPVLAGAPFGHGERNRPWVLGAPVTVDPAAGVVTHREGLLG